MQCPNHCRVVKICSKVGRPDCQSMDVLNEVIAETPGESREGLGIRDGLWWRGFYRWLIPGVIESPACEIDDDERRVDESAAFNHQLNVHLSVASIEESQPIFCTSLRPSYNLLTMSWGGWMLMFWGIKEGVLLEYPPFPPKKAMR